MQVQLAAAEVLKRVIDSRSSLDRALENYFPKVEDDRGRLQEISYGACRFYIYFDAVLGRLLKKPIKERDRIIHFLLVCALYQIEYMRTPDHAVVNRSVKALEKTSRSWARNLVNGVLRNYLRQQDNIKGLAFDEAERNAFPDFWPDVFRRSWPQHCIDIMSAANERPPMTLRINRAGETRESYMRRLDALGVGFVLTEQSDCGVQLVDPMPVERVPGFEEGRVSVQDESAQLVTSLMRLDSNQRVLDGCAAPGSKTCAMLECEPDLQSITAVDVEKRVHGIEQNLQRLSLNARVIAADLHQVNQWWDGLAFDRILLDVPCSGSGVIRRHPDIKHRRRPSDFEKFAEKQFRLLCAVWPTLAKGGLLLYVTCSVIDRENDGVIGRFITEYNDAQIDPLDESLGVATKFGRQRLPGVHSGDGFYYCRVKKRSD